MSMSDILAALLFLLVPLRHSKADRRMAKDTFALKNNAMHFRHRTEITEILVRCSLFFGNEARNSFIS